MILKTNVKVNLGLAILRRRSDGYHDIETVFLPYDGLGDTLEIIPGDGYSETSASLFAKYGPLPENVPEGYVPNLVQAISEDGKVMVTIARSQGVDWNPLKDLTVKAYNILAKDFKLPPVKIFLEKTAPVGAGLGGGSADAAFALKAYNELFSLGLSDESLAGYASELGSDCAFFIWNRPMMGEGRGEILSPFELAGLSDYELKVIVPEGVSVSTREAYGGVVPRNPEVHDSPLREALSYPISRWKDVLVNDFEATVFALHPELGAIKQSLYDSGAVYASMSGSGSALYALYKK